MKSMKSRIATKSFPKDDDQECSVGSSSRGSRGRIRIRRSSSSKNSKNKNNNNGCISNYSTRHVKPPKVSKRPYLYKPMGECSPVKQTHSTSLGTTGNRNEFLLKNSNHWVDWIDSSIELLGCGMTSDVVDLAVSKDDKISSPRRSQNAIHDRYDHDRYHYQNPKHNEQIDEAEAILDRHKELMHNDFKQLHDDFFDSLVKEEGDKMLSAAVAATEVDSIQSTSVRINRVCSSQSVASGLSSVSSPSAIAAETNKVNPGSVLNNKNSKESKKNHIRGNNKGFTALPSTKVWENGSKNKRRRQSSIDTNMQEYDRLYNPYANVQAAKLSSNTTTNSNSSSADGSSAMSSKSMESGKKTKSSTSSALRIKDVMSRENLHPSKNYLHQRCKLQKDKGKGDRLGSSISATGIEPCLEKLREKIKLIIEVSGELQGSAPTNSNEIASVKSVSSKSSICNHNSTNGSSSKSGISAGMKRRQAKIALIEKNSGCDEGRLDGSCIIETRSMIELQLGFLSMQYGLMLRWDAYHTGQIVYVCLRKMCHDSFYSKLPPSPAITTMVDITSSQKKSKNKSKNVNEYRSSSAPSKHDNDSSGPPRIIDTAKKRDGPSPLVIRSKTGTNNAIYQRSSGSTEVVLVDEPYRIPQPHAFAPSVLILDVHSLIGSLDPKSHWTLSMTFDGHTEIARLNYNNKEQIFKASREAPCRWEMLMMPTESMKSFEIATGLEIRLFEQRANQRRKGVSSVGGIITRRSTSSSNSLLTTQNRHLNQNVSRHGKSNSAKAFNSESSVASNISREHGSTSRKNSIPKKTTSHLASTVTVPLGGLLTQPSVSHSSLWKLTIPFIHDEDESYVNITLTHESDYAYWLHKELRARRKEVPTLTSTGGGTIGLSRHGSHMLDCLVSSSNHFHGYEDISFIVEDEKRDDESDLSFGEWVIFCCG